MGVYRLLECPFCISTVPGEHQARIVHEVLKDYYQNGAIVFIGDTVFYGRDVEGFLDPILGRVPSLMFGSNRVNVFWNDINRIPGSRFRYQWSKAMRISRDFWLNHLNLS